MRSVASLLQSLGLGQCGKAFEETDIDQEVLFELTEQDLRDLGIDSLGHRKKLLKAIRALDTAGGVGPT